jgi:hypothetical protein
MRRRFEGYRRGKEQANMDQAVNAALEDRGHTELDIPGFCFVRQMA